MSKAARFEFSAALWEHSGQASWHFVTVPEQISDEIATLTEGAHRGFGSVRVEVTVGVTVWRTSLFPDSAAYVLPVKKAVRIAEGLLSAESVRVGLLVLDAPGGGIRRGRGHDSA